MTGPQQLTASLFQLINREIWVVTAAAGQDRGGLVATWVSVTSLDDERPVMLAGIAPNHYTRDLIDRSGAFALHLVTAEQVEVAFHFALGSGRDRDKLAGVDVCKSELGNPIVQKSLAWFDCKVFARQETGDRIFYWADVVASGQLATGEPLREHELFLLASEEQKNRLNADRDADVALHRPWHVAWRENLSGDLKPG